jgi:hypothetical protein
VGISDNDGQWISRCAFHRRGVRPDWGTRVLASRSASCSFPVKRVVIDFCRVLFWSNHPQKALTYSIVRYSEFRNIPSIYYELLRACVSLGRTRNIKARRERSTAHRRPCQRTGRIRCPNLRRRLFLECNSGRGQDARHRDALQFSGRAIHFYNGGQVGRQEYSELSNSALLALSASAIGRNRQLGIFRNSEYRNVFR